MKVMIVDDSRAMRMLLTGMLEEMGITELAQAADGKEAFSQLQQAPNFDLVLVDWNMPNMNGYELVQAVRQDPRFENTRLMMVTTETEMNQVVKALEAGANEYIMKPFTKEVIHEKMQILGLV